MSATLPVIMFAVAAVGIFVLGMSLTLILRGRHMQSEIGDNPHMKERGIECASRQFMDEERALRGGCGIPGPACDPGGCGTGCRMPASDNRKRRSESL